MRRLPSDQTNYHVRRERDTRSLRRLAVLLLCGLMLAGGFVYAAGQHFAALRYGYKNEELRQKQAELLEEQHRLMLERERATNPEHLGAAASVIGLQPMQPAQIDPASRIEVAQPDVPTGIASSSAKIGN